MLLAELLRGTASLVEHSEMCYAVVLPLPLKATHHARPLVTTALPRCGKAGSREWSSATVALLPPQRPSEPGLRI